MKKLLPLLLAICLLLTACGQSTPPQDSDTPPDTDSSIVNADTPQELLAANRDIASALVVLSVNPSFHIFLIDTNITFEVVANNADAAAVLDGNNFSGWPFNDTLSELLRLLQHNGYLRSDVTVDFEVFTFDQNDSLAAITQTVDDAAGNAMSAGVAFQYTNSVSIVDSNPNTNPDDRYMLVERDKDGNITKTVEDKQDTILTLHYENGSKVKELCESKDGSYRYETVYNTDGIPVSETGSNEEYTYETKYHANGKRLSETQQFFNGRVSAMYYDTDGNKTEYFVSDPDGTHSETTYYPSGATKSSRVYGNGGDNKYYFDESGNKTAYEGLDSNGWPVAGTYAADGSGTFTTTRPDGTIVISTVDANGNVLNQQVK